MYRASLGMLARSNGTGFLAGTCVATDKYDVYTISCSSL
jgi:hypothetical protein